MSERLQSRNDKMQALVRWLFLSIIVSGIIVSLIRIILTHGEALNTLLFHNPEDTFADFFSIIPASGSMGTYLYEDLGAIYPPMAYIVANFLGNFLLPGQLYDMLPMDLRNTQLGLMLTLMYTLLCVLPLCYMLYRKTPGKEIMKLVFPLCLLFSGPFLYLVERGNILLPTLVLLCAFVVGQQSKSRILREISLLCLALAASIKIYPAIFGLFLLCDKRYKEAVRCVIYGILFFFVPFFFFGGLPIIKLLIQNLSGYAQSAFMKATGIGFRVDLSALLAGVTLFTDGTAQLGMSIASATMVPIAILLLIGFFFLEKRWKKMLCLSLLMVAMPSFSYTYTMVFYALPALLFLQDQEHHRKDIPYAILLAGLLVPLAFGNQQFFPWLNTGYPLTLTVFVENMCQLLLITMLGVETLAKVITALRRKATVLSAICVTVSFSMVLWAGIAGSREVSLQHDAMAVSVYAPIDTLFQAANISEDSTDYITEYGDHLPRHLGIEQSHLIANDLTTSTQALVGYLSKGDKPILMSAASLSRLESRLGREAFWRALCKAYNLGPVQNGFYLFLPSNKAVTKNAQQFSFYFPEDTYEMEEDVYWCQNDFVLQILNPYATDTEITLQFTASPAVWEEGNAFTLLCGQQSQTLSFTDGQSSFSADFTLAPGINEIAFNTTTPPDGDSLSEIERYFALSGISVMLPCR